MPSVTEHRAAAEAARALRNAAASDEDRTRLDHAWSHHMTAAHHTSYAGVQRRAAQEARRSAARARDRGQLAMAQNFEAQARAAETRAEFLDRRAQERSEAGEKLMNPGSEAAGEE